MKWYRLFENQARLDSALGSDARKIVRLGERRICLVKHEGRYHAFDNLCPHNLHSLFEGNINYLGEVICPLHSYRYNLKDGLECEGRSGSLTIHQIEFREEGIFLGVND